MRIIRNQRRIRTLGFIGQSGAWAGFIILIVSIVAFWSRPTWLLGGMVLGYALVVGGGMLSDIYVGPMAHHEALAETLKYLGRRYTLLQYLLPASHVLLEPGGCTVFVVKAQGGEVSCEEGKWSHKQRGKLFRQFAGQERIGSPNIKAEHQRSKLKRWLTKRLPDIEVPIRATILFVNPDVTLEVDDSPVPVFHGKRVRAWLRGPGQLDPLPADVQKQLAQALTPRK